MGCLFLPTRRGGGTPKESLLQGQLQEIWPPAREANATHGIDVLLLRKDIAPHVELLVMRPGHERQSGKKCRRRKRPPLALETTSPEGGKSAASATRLAAAAT